MGLPFSNIIVTGGAGFVGSHLALALRKHYDGIEVRCLDNLRRRGSEANLERLDKAGIEVIRGDIRCPDDLEACGSFDLLVECSAEPAVIAGYKNPKYMIDTNLVGALNCLEACRKQSAGFFFISTSRVYSIDALNRIGLEERDTRFAPTQRQVLPGIGARGITEDFPTTGVRSIYGAAKLAVEILAEEYTAAFDVRCLINRCSILTGPWQMGKVDQGVIAYWILCHCFGRPLKYIGFGGEGKQVRDFLDIDDYSTAFLMQLVNFNDLSGKIYNVGGGTEHSLSLKELTDMSTRITGTSIQVDSDPIDRPGDIPYFVSDSSRLAASIGWRPVLRMENTLERIYQWIRENKTVARRLL